MMLRFAQARANLIVFTTPSFSSKILHTHYMVLHCEYGLELTRSVPKLSEK